jgi:hypothetical protein
MSSGCFMARSPIGARDDSRGEKGHADYQTASGIASWAAIVRSAFMLRFGVSMGRRSWGALLLVCVVACGGGASPKAPAKGAPYMRAQTAKEEPPPDVDRDGIPDADDKKPADESVRGNFAAAPTQAPPPPPPPPPGAPPPPNPIAQQTEEAARDPSMVVYTARVTMAVYQVDTGITAVEKIGKDMGGFLAKKGDREITIRVPRARFQIALAAIDKIGDVLHRDIQAQDVTDEYTDLEIRIKNARAMQTRLKQLLERAAVKEALEIEKELARVTQELELFEGKLKLLRDKIAYSTITVAFEPRGSTLETSRVRLPFPWLSELGLPALLRLEETK